MAYTIQGFPVVVEHAAGTTRSGTARDGTAWERVMVADYGYLDGTEGADGDPLDVYIVYIAAESALQSLGNSGGNIGGNVDLWGPLWVIDQVDHETGIFDEHKAVVGPPNEQEARALYLTHYPEGWRGLGAICELSGEEFRRWVMRPGRAQEPLTLNHSRAGIGRSVGGTAGGTIGDDLDPICPDCGTELEWNAADGTCNHCGGTRAPTTTNDAGQRIVSQRTDGDTMDPITKCPNCERRVEIYRADPAPCWSCGEVPPEASFDAQNETSATREGADVLVSESRDYELLADSGRGILRVRHLATVADSVNGNDRIYPREVLQRAIEEARPRARAGAMLSEYKHPTPVRVDGTEKFVDNHDQKTATVDDITDVQSDGTVWVTRTILGTARGRDIAADYRAGNPVGVSVRWKMRGKRKTINKRSVTVADDLVWLNIDDVPNPAVPQTRHAYQLLTDALLAELGLPTGMTATTTAPPTSLAPDSAETNDQRRERNTRVKDAIRKNIGALIAAAAMQTLTVDALRAKRQEITQQMRLVQDAGEDISDLAALVLNADNQMMSIPGYMSGMGQRGVPGNKTGTPDMLGWGAEIEQGAAEPTAQVAQDPDDDAEKSGARGETKMDGVGGVGGMAKLSKEDRDALAFARAQQEAATKATADAQRKEAIKAAVDSLRSDILSGLSVAEQDFIAGAVLATAPNAAAVPEMLRAQVDAYSALAAKQRLAGGGHGVDPNRRGAAAGQTVRSGGRAYDTGERKPEYVGVVDKLRASMDDYARHNPMLNFDPDSSVTQSIRKYNEPFARSLVEDCIAKREKAGNWEEWIASIDAEGGEGTIRAMGDAMERAGLVFDATTLANLYNQPSISMALLMQSFQDLEGLQFVEAIGPSGGNSPNSASWFNFGNGGTNQIGQVLRIPVEYITEPSGWGAFGPQDDLGLHTPENTGIDELGVNLMWLPYAPVWARIAASITKDAIVGLGQGPLNYGVVGRHLFHLAYAKQRRIDRALYDEMLDASDEYGAVTVSAESSNLTNNSVYNAGGSLTVNLNTAKTAAAAVSATDPSITYGPSVIGAVRLVGLGTGTYCGSAAGVTPVVRPRTVVDLSASGAATSTVSNPIAVSAPGSAVRGFLDNNANIASFPGTTATYAVDYNNGVLLFASGVTGSGGLITTTVTVSYSYATNFDDFVLNNPTLATGEVPYQYYSRLLERFDNTAAIMGGAPRFVKPNLAIMSLKASVPIANAATFYKLNSPDGTSLFPTESFFAERTGVMMARINTPWRAGDTRIQLFRRGATKYGVSEPFQINGPYPSYDSSSPQKVVAKDIYYGQEYSVIATPQVKNQAGTILNPVGRHIRLR